MIEKKYLVRDAHLRNANISDSFRTRFPKKDFPSKLKTVKGSALQYRYLYMYNLNFPRQMFLFLKP